MEKEIIDCCPFCGSKPKILEVEFSNGARYNEKIPEGAYIYNSYNTFKFVNHEKVTITRYCWRINGYKIICSNKKCIANSIIRKFKTREEAIRSWNRSI